ncbi:MAG: hypothetical protein J6W40_00345 [Alphaproteobacteria bacterium]|nr:hypothetical protein [Alphaproteobacteria bacterium]
MKKYHMFILGSIIGVIVGLVVSNINWGFIRGNTVECPGGGHPDKNGCCAGEVYTDMGDQGFNCCPKKGGDCFPPIVF